MGVVTLTLTTSPGNPALRTLVMSPAGFLVSKGAFAFSCDASALPDGCWPTFLWTWPVFSCYRVASITCRITGRRASSSRQKYVFAGVFEVLPNSIPIVLGVVGGFHVASWPVFLWPLPAGRLVGGAGSAISWRITGHHCLRLSFDLPNQSEATMFRETTTAGELFSKQLRAPRVRRVRKFNPRNRR